jgi:EAL domain-containing protein (putative c-di-GMP-specific phosphodiesterase class I)
VVVAEGVETQEQLAYLQRNECDIVQGYYFSRPMDSVAAFEFLERFSSKNTP